jgi:thioredoxin 1
MSYAKFKDLGENIQEKTVTAIRNDDPFYSQIEIVSREQKMNLINSKRIVVVDIYAEWCQPCKQIESRYINFAREHTSNDVVLMKENVDLKISDNIRGVPYFQFYKDGNMIGEITGADIDSVKKKTLELIGEIRGNHQP